MPAHKDLSTVKNELHGLLLTAVPLDSRGQKTITHLARQLNLSKACIWKWIDKETIPARRAVQIVNLSEGRTTLADFNRFVYNF